jgi:hypothetical protein
MVDPKTLLVALVFTVAVLGGKSLAAVVAGRTFHFTWPEIGVMSGLSGSQAAATLATTLVGAKLGLFDTTTINAVLVVILASLIVTPLMVSKFGKRVPTAVEDEAAGEMCWFRSGTGEPARSAGGTPGEQRRSGVAASFANVGPPDELKAQRLRRRRRSGWQGRPESRTLPGLPDGPRGPADPGRERDVLLTEWRMRDRI